MNPKAGFPANPHLEAVGEELQLGEEFSVGVEVLKSFQTLETDLTLLRGDQTSDGISVLKGEVGVVGLGVPM